MRKFKFEEATKQNIITLTISGVLLICFFFVLKNFTYINQSISKVSGILISFILGFFIAFVLSPINKFIETRVFVKLKINPKTKRVVSSLLTLLLALAGLGSFLAMALPQLTTSVIRLINILPDYLTMAEKISDDLLTKFSIEKSVIGIWTQYSEELFNTVINLASQYLPQILNYSIKVGSGILKFIISLAVALYIMIDKERFAKQFRKLSYAFLSNNNADKIVDFSRVCSKVFNRFIIGKILDSIIIGILTYLGLLVLRIPFALLLSVIIGVTNMIPVFGPFIGAIPGVFILFIVDPIMVVWFCLFVLVLQQLDGNIIGPAILGDSLGLPNLWIVFSIVIGGGFYGVLGMFFGVPIFAVIYFYIKKATERRLNAKQLKIE